MAYFSTNIQEFKAVNTKHEWQKSLSNLITDPQELLKILELEPALLPKAKLAAKQFPLIVPRTFVDRMEKGNPNDPLLRQILPLDMELHEHADFSTDPLQELNVNPLPGLLHKYHGRVLITLTSACAVHCRYCFRRNFPYEENNPGKQGWSVWFDYIKHNHDISEVILSGGDPLLLNDKSLRLFTDELSQISHVKRLRLHTRVPVVLPERVTDEFLTWLDQLTFATVIVIHMNHPREMSDAVKSALLKLKQKKITLLNQTVLLKGVNDRADILCELSETLFAAGVLPYYLHVLDKVKGTAHFDLPDATAITLHAEMINALPGYLVPKLVREEAGKAAKTLLT
jgi:EF-P beta-lysylation protein EpmB